MEVETFLSEDGESGDEDASVHSAISNASDFYDDESTDYLALDLLHHLPGDKADKLLKNLRTKEKAILDLMKRNLTLLNSCKRLDEENQSLTEKIQTVQKEASPSSVSKPVDMSIFQQMERGKEQKILKLTADNESLSLMCRRMEDRNRRLEEALDEARRDLKRAQKGQTGRPAAEIQRSADRVGVDTKVLDEEERLFREMQGESREGGLSREAAEAIAAAALRAEKHFKSVLESWFCADVSLIQRWGSDIQGLLLAMDGLESHLKVATKEPKGSKKSKAIGQLQNDFEALRTALRAVEKAQCELEALTKGSHDLVAAAVSNLDTEAAKADVEVEGLCDRGMIMSERIRTLSVGPSDHFCRTEEAVRTLLANTPPGLLPPNVEQGLRDHLVELRNDLNAREQLLSDLQKESADFTARAKHVKASLPERRTSMRAKVLKELQNIAAGFEGPAEQLRGAVKHQSETFQRARTQALSSWEGAPVAGGSENLGSDPLAHLRELRSMGKALGASLEERGKRLAAALASLNNEGPRASSSGQGIGANRAPEVGDSGTAKSKKGKKKSTSGTTDTVGAASASVAASALGGAERAEVCNRDAKKDTQPAARHLEDDAKLRAEFRAACRGGSKENNARKDGNAGKEERAPSLSGPDLLQGLKALRSDTEALEARMAARMQSRADDGDPDTTSASSAPAVVKRKKKMYA